MHATKARTSPRSLARHTNAFLPARRRLVLFLLVCFTLGRCIAQGPALVRNSLQAETPLAMTPGAPAGSYSLSGFDNVNLYNGNLNTSLPLLQIGGRGGAHTVLTLGLNSK